MAKEYSFYLGKSLEKLLKNPIKNQLDLVRLILRTAQEIINPVSDTREIKDEKFVEKDEGFRIVYPDLPKEKLQRIFFWNKYPDFKALPMYTIQTSVFPFKIVKNEYDDLKLFYNSSSIKIEFDAAVISIVLTVINIIDNKELTWGDTWVEELMDLLHGKNKVVDTEDIFYIVNDFLTFDFGYLRFDNDPEHEKSGHPIYHLDICMNNKASFKLGLYDKLKINEFKGLLDNTSDIFFLEKQFLK